MQRIDSDKIIGIRIYDGDKFDEISYGTRDNKSARIVSFKSYNEFNRFMKTFKLLYETLEQQTKMISENNED